MKKTFLFSVFIFTLFAASRLFAVEPASDDASLPELKSSSGQLVNLDLSQAVRRISDLERELQDLERDNRYQDDRIRQLERSINDIRRERRL